MKLKAKGLARIRGRLAVMLSRCPDPIETRHAYERLADELQLDREALNRRYSGGDNEWHVLVRTAYKQLRAMGYATLVGTLNRGHWSLTDEGQAYARRIEDLATGRVTLEELGL